MDWTYLLLEWLVVNALWKGGDRRRQRPSRPEPLYPEPERLEVLRAALESGSDVQIVYFSASSGKETERVVTPQSLWQAQAGQWLLTAQDHLRGDRRTFRVDRIRELTAALDSHPTTVAAGSRSPEFLPIAGNPDPSYSRASRPRGRRTPAV